VSIFLFIFFGWYNGSFYLFTTKYCDEFFACTSLERGGGGRVGEAGEEEKGMKSGAGVPQVSWRSLR